MTLTHMKNVSDLDDFDKWILIQDWIKGFKPIQRDNILRLLTMEEH